MLLDRSMFCLARRGALVRLLEQAINPAMLVFHLLNHQLQHPDSFMIWMSDFIEDVSQCGALVLQALLQKFFPGVQLFAKCARPSLPGQSQPNQERLMYSILDPMVAFQRVSQTITTSRRRFKDSALRSGSGRFVRPDSNQA